MKNNGVGKKLFVVSVCVGFGVVFMQSALSGLSSKIKYQESIIPNIILIVVALIFYGMGIGFFQKSFSSHEQAVKRFLVANPVAGIEQKVNCFLEETAELNNIKINDDFIYFYIDALNCYLDNAFNVVWAYAKYTSYQYYGYEAAGGYDIIIRFLNGKGYLLTLRNRMEGEQILQKISNHCPKAVIGYADDLDRMYRRNREKFLKLRYYVDSNN